MGRQTREARALLLHSNVFPDQPMVRASDTYTRRSLKVGETQWVTPQATYTLTRMEIAPNDYNGIDILLYFSRGEGDKLVEWNLTYSGAYTINWVYGENHE